MLVENDALCHPEEVQETGPTPQPYRAPQEGSCQPNLGSEAMVP